MQSSVSQRPEVQIFGLPIWNPTYEELRKWLGEGLATTGGATRLLGIVNAHTLNLVYDDPSYGACLNAMDGLVNDGVGIQMAARMRGAPFRDNLNGTDLFPRWMADPGQPVRVFLYGTREDSNAGAARAIADRFPQVQVVGRIHGFVDPAGEALPAIAASGADLLLVALGQPRQEQFLVEYRNRLNVRVACGVGALLDFLSGTIPRAPGWLRRMRIEWLWRFGLEPRRMFRRYVTGNPRFLLRAALWARRDGRGETNR